MADLPPRWIAFACLELVVNQGGVSHVSTKASTFFKMVFLHHLCLGRMHFSALGFRH